MNLDRIVGWVNPDYLNEGKIYLEENLFSEYEISSETKQEYGLFLYENPVLKDKDVWIEKDENSWIIHSNYYPSNHLVLKISSLIQTFCNKGTDTESELIFDCLYSYDSLSSDKQTLAFFVITSLYFTALNFSTSMSGEIVNEKTSGQLNLLLSCITTRQHFSARILVSWMQIILQSLFVLLEFLFWFSLRSIYDKGKGLFHLAKQMGLITENILSFQQLFLKMMPDKSFLGILLLILVFLFLGIFIIQLILAILSSFVSNIEEASAVSSPCYLFLMALYYLALSLNNIPQMSTGVGKTLSYVPVFSMIFMPCRLILNTAETTEILISIIISLVCILFILEYGEKLYDKGIRNGWIYRKLELPSVLLQMIHNKKERK